VEDIYSQTIELTKQVKYWHGIFKDSNGSVEAEARSNRDRVLSEMGHLREEAYRLSGGNTSTYSKIDEAVNRAFAFNS
jgi:hypothetical protein